LLARYAIVPPEVFFEVKNALISFSKSVYDAPPDPLVGWRGDSPFSFPTRLVAYDVVALFVLVSFSETGKCSLFFIPVAL